MTTSFESKLIRDLEKKKRSLRQDRRSTPSYWNGDDWGSSSGILDAENWVNSELERWLRNRLKSYKVKR